MKLIQDYKFRRWLYGVALAVLVFLGGEGIISAAQQENIGAIVAAVLQTVPAAGFALAMRKADPVEAAKGTDTVVYRTDPDDTSDLLDLPDFISISDEDTVTYDVTPVETSPKHAAN